MAIPQTWLQVPKRPGALGTKVENPLGKVLSRRGAGTHTHQRFFCHGSKRSSGGTVSFHGGAGA